MENSFSEKGQNWAGEMAQMLKIYCSSGDLSWVPIIHSYSSVSSAPWHGMPSHGLREQLYLRAHTRPHITLN